jgi:hypothetical protein
LPGDLGDFGMEASDLLGKTLLVKSVAAVQHRENWTVLPAGLRLRRREVGMPKGLGVCLRRDQGRRRYQAAHYQHRCGVHQEILMLP